MELKVTEYENSSPGVAVVRLARPARGNSWTHRMRNEYRFLMARADADESVRVIVVTGAGRQFCVGADFRAIEHHASTPETYTEESEALGAAKPGYGVRPEFDHELAWHWGLRKPVIAAVNGACAGIALAIVAFADLRFAAAGAKVTAATARLGMPAEYGLDWTLPRIVGLTHAADILMTGRVFAAEEGANMGLFNAIFPRATFYEQVMERAQWIAQNVSPYSAMTVKRQLYARLLGGDVGSAVEASRTLIGEMFAHPDAHEGLAALLERRSPEFSPLGADTKEPAL